MRQRVQGSCMVCGDIAVGINFGVPTCAPCKAFFRRNAVKLGKVDFVCQENGDCPVNSQSRRMCNCCRLAKCFRVGMKRSLILTDAEKEARKELVQRNRLKRAQQLRNSFIEQNQPRSSTDSKSLSPCDEFLLNNICESYERTCRKSPTSEFELLLQSSSQWNLETFFNHYSSIHISLIDYFKLIPEFHRLELNEKIYLMRNHFLINLSLNLPLLYPDIQRRLSSCDRTRCDPTIIDSVLAAFQSMESSICDPNLLKILLIITTLSSAINRSSIAIDLNEFPENTLTIFTAQNLYVELLWRYLLSRVSSEQDAVKFFNKLLLILLFLQRITFLIDDHIGRTIDQLEQVHPFIQNMWPSTKKETSLKMNF